ncbi:hypothetical protein P43SY_009950 [Pythium insidiosum]|uniref:Elicitin-like protein n=1 Tax=Pythium insidiosum TaxID=114742 RepID=A0AAD5LHV0_PYTIN|nr:hypothetical protein P43SY_009950 [Pythium insidiosum]
MQLSPFVSVSALVLAVLGAIHAAPCDLGEIQGKLLPNGTEGLKKCAETTGFDIWAPTNFPTPEQAEKIMTTRYCVDFLNQINQRANQQIQCEFEIGGQSRDFGFFLTQLLTGKTGNETKSMAGSDSDEIEVPSSDSSTDGKKKNSLLDSSSDKDLAPSPTRKSSTPATTAPAGNSASAAALSAGVIAAATLATLL